MGSGAEGVPPIKTTEEGGGGSAFAPQERGSAPAPCSLRKGGNPRLPVLRGTLDAPGADVLTSATPARGMSRALWPPASHSVPSANSRDSKQEVKPDLVEGAV